MNGISDPVKAKKTFKKKHWNENEHLRDPP